MGSNPPCETAHGAVAAASRAGVRAVTVTGDEPRTAIARSCGIGGAHPGVLGGPAMDQLADDELGERVGDVDVFAHIAPAQKLRIVGALQRRGEVVAMTGDGVNDATLAVATGAAAPLTVAQILTALTDGLPAVALGLDPADEQLCVSQRGLFGKGSSRAHVAGLRSPRCSPAPPSSPRS